MGSENLEKSRKQATERAAPRPTRLELPRGSLSVCPPCRPDGNLGLLLLVPDPHLLLTCHCMLHANDHISVAPLCLVLCRRHSLPACKSIAATAETRLSTYENCGCSSEIRSTSQAPTVGQHCQVWMSVVDFTCSKAPGRSRTPLSVPTSASL